MVGTRKSKEQDSNVWFCKEKKAGILIQPQLKKAIYFVNGENIDTLWYEKDTPVSVVEQWVEAKRKHYMSLPQ